MLQATPRRWALCSAPAALLAGTLQTPPPSARPAQLATSPPPTRRRVTFARRASSVETDRPSVSSAHAARGANSSLPRRAAFLVCSVLLCGRSCFDLFCSSFAALPLRRGAILGGPGT